MCFINAGFKSAQHPIQRKASSYGSMEGQKTDTFKQQFSEQTKQPINSDGPQEPFKAGQHVRQKPSWWCAAQEVQTDMMMMNILQHIKAKERQKEYERERQTHALWTVVPSEVLTKFKIETSVIISHSQRKKLKKKNRPVEVISVERYIVYVLVKNLQLKNPDYYFSFFLSFLSCSSLAWHIVAALCEGSFGNQYTNQYISKNPLRKEFGINKTCH